MRMIHLALIQHIKANFLTPVHDPRNPNMILTLMLPARLCDRRFIWLSVDRFNQMQRPPAVVDCEATL